MAKKLMMNNYSENGLLPITDGLVCWLDGRDGQNGDTVWKDRSGNDNDVVITNTSVSDVNGTVFFSKSLKAYGKSLNPFTLTIKDEKTIEIKYLYKKLSSVG